MTWPDPSAFKFFLFFTFLFSFTLFTLLAYFSFSAFDICFYVLCCEHMQSAPDRCHGSDTSWYCVWCSVHLQLRYALCSDTPTKMLMTVWEESLVLLQRKWPIRGGGLISNWVCAESVHMHSVRVHCLLVVFVALDKRTLMLFQQCFVLRFGRAAPLISSSNL